VFLINQILAIVAALFYSLYFIGIFIDSYRVNKNLSVAFLSIPSAFVQMGGYGLGFFKQWIKSYMS
jgi:hypothetical protein